MCVYVYISVYEWGGDVLTVKSDNAYSMQYAPFYSIVQRKGN